MSTLNQMRKQVRRLQKSLGSIRQQSAAATDRLPFGLDWMRRYLPHWCPVAPNQLHRDVAGDLQGLHHHRGSWRVYEAPRGAAKSTWLSKGYPLYCAVEGIEQYTLLLSDSGTQAEGFLDAVRVELEGNARLAGDYPEACGIGPIWKGSRVRLRNGCQIDALGSGGRIRGRANRGIRPSLVVVDDANEKTDAYSPTTRRRRWDWFTRDVMSVGTARTNVLVAGTPIHREAISHRLRTSPGWQARAYRSIERWPDRVDLWEQWERILTNLANIDRDAEAAVFYAEHQSEMNAGADVFWPEWEPLESLMRLRATIGPSAFDGEKQDRPGVDGATEWPSEYFDWPGFWFDEWPELVAKVLSLDPSKGEGARPGDYQAHGMIGLAKDGTIYVDADLRREPVPQMIARSLDLCRSWGDVRELTVETNSTLGLIIPEFERLARERGQLVNLVGVNNTDAKLSRIRGLGGYLSRRQIRVRNTHGGRLLVEQLRDVPSGDHDDGPDTVSLGVRRLEAMVNGQHQQPWTVRQ